MYDALNEELSQLREQMQRRTRKQSKLKACQLQLSEAREEVSKLRESLSENEHLLEKLHGLSFLHLMAMIKGIEDTQDEEIHRKAAQQSGKLNTAVAIAQRLEAEENQLQHELRLTDGIEQTYQKTLHEKEQAIAAGQNRVLAQKLLEYTHREADYNAEVKETEEALAAAHDAIGALKECMESLRKAQNWGTMDMFGGGTITTMIKRGHMDDAQSNMDTASYYINRLQRELQDLDESFSTPVKIQKGGFLHFADYFFDGLFVDWAVQNQIKEAAARVDQHYNSIDRLVSELESRLSTLKRDAASVQRDRKQLVEQAGV